MSSITEVDVKSFVERINHMVIAIQLIIEKYMEPILSAYQQMKSTAILWFNGEQLVPLGTQVTPIEAEALFIARQIEDYPTVKDEMLNKWASAWTLT